MRRRLAQQARACKDLDVPRAVHLILLTATIGCSEASPSTPAGSTTTTSSAASGGGSGGSGGAGGAAPELLNGCDRSDVLDATLEAEVTVATDGANYVPPCVLLRPSAAVRFTADFTKHPLVGGIVTEEDGQTPDPTSPIPSTSAGTEVLVTFEEAGEYGFYCAFHASIGMAGVVFVEDEP